MTKGNPFQLTHLLRGATGLRGLRARFALISTHTPLARCDISSRLGQTGEQISTHAPLARCDTRSWGARQNPPNFNSRTSCEVRHGHLRRQYRRHHEFQLTHLLRGATAQQIAALNGMTISTHAPLARCDTFAAISLTSSQFQLTHLLRGATQHHQHATTAIIFQLTHLLRGATVINTDIRDIIVISTHAPLARCDPCCPNWRPCC